MPRPKLPLGSQHRRIPKDGDDGGLSLTTNALRERKSTWALIVAALVVTVGADVFYAGRVAGGLVYVLGVLPGLVAFLAWRSLLVSAVVTLAPVYFLIDLFNRGRVAHVPALDLDRGLPLRPEWMVVYGSLYVFVVVLPVLVVRERTLGSHALRAYLAVMVISYAGFLLYPTVGPRPSQVLEQGFAAWSLQLVYDLDAPYNCFPSLHVAYAFVAALTCYRVHRGVGFISTLWAALIGVSTLYTKQHYVADVLGGTLAACCAYVLFLRHHPREAVTPSDHRLAPARAAIAAAIFGVMGAGFWLAYRL